MSEREGRQVYSIAAHRGFADALVAGLVPRYSDPELGLARLTLLLPSQRAIRTVTEAFVRHSGEGLLLPRMAAVGDLDLDETLGPLLDPMGAGVEIPAAVDPTYRWLRLAELLRKERPGASGAALLREAAGIASTMDKLLVEGIGLDDLVDRRIAEIVGELAEHWKAATRTFATVLAHWLSELAALDQIDAPTRRNLLFDHAARRWKDAPPAHPIVAAGVTSASPALARLLRVVAELPGCAVILPDLDLSLDGEVWEALGRAGMPDEAGGEPFGANDAVTHPQYHLKLLLGRMGINRGEVQQWHRSGIAASPPERSKAISNLFLPPKASARWVKLEPGQRRMSGVRLMESPHPGAEAQGIAVLIRQALEVPAKRVALVTPDRELAARVIGHLARWGIEADDSAGQPLPLTPAGRLFLQLADLAASDASPVPLLALLGHPHAGKGDGRADWLDNVRLLDLALRGPRPGPGLAPIAPLIGKLEKRRRGIGEWWGKVEAMLSPVVGLDEDVDLATALDALTLAAEAISDGAVWSSADGRALARMIEELRSAARQVGTRIERDSLATALRDAMDRVAVRPPWGGHPRIAIYGLIEARMSRADLVICGGMTEGVWPAAPAPDALLAPAVLRALGVPGADFRIGLSAHDLAAALGAPEVVLSHARRDASGPAIPSRFVLRLRAMLGEKLLAEHAETDAVELAQALGEPAQVAPHPQPRPRPSAEQRDVAIAVTGLDRLRGDPYQFYASEILRLRKLDAIDAEPTAAWKGTAVHAILEAWHRDGGSLKDIAEAELAKMSAHPLVRGLWWPRLVAALEWVEDEVAALNAQGRTVIASEVRGDVTLAGVKLKGRADRIDRLPSGELAIVDYKTGGPPSPRMVEDGFALQLGLIGLMAQNGAFAGVSGLPTHFEYWSLAKGKSGFGYRSEPVKEGRRTSGLLREEFLERTRDYLIDAIEKWIKGDEPFTARLNPDLPAYTDYDQLMRLDEWQARGSEREEGV